MDVHKGSSRFSNFSVLANAKLISIKSLLGNDALSKSGNKLCTKTKDIIAKAKVIALLCESWAQTRARTYYRKRGNASYIVREEREVREREREREINTKNYWK